MYSDFVKNREAVQNILFESKLWKVFDEDQYPFTIVENGIKATLKKVVVTNVPVSNDIERSFIVDLEKKVSFFTTVQKTSEQALLLVGSQCIDIFMFELKSVLRQYDDDDTDDFSSIKRKFQNTKSRILTMLPIFIFGKEFEHINIRFKGIVCYNDDSFLVDKNSKKLKNSFLYRALVERKGEIDIVEDINGRGALEVFFLKNPSLSVSPNSFAIDFSELFLEDWEYELAKISDLGLPQKRSATEKKT